MKEYPQCLLLEGGPPSLREGEALAVAAAIFCREAEPPCRVCEECRSVFERTHPSLFFVTPEEGEIRVDDVRRIRGEVSLKALTGERRVVIIHPAEKLNRNAANALLRVLEEPPGGVFFILTVGNRGRLPVTLLSRLHSHRLEVGREPAEEDYPVSRLLDALVQQDMREVEAFSKFFRDAEREDVDRRIFLLRRFFNALLELSLGSKRGIIELGVSEGKARLLARSPDLLREISDRIRPVEDLSAGLDRSFIVRASLVSLMKRSGR
ncbi:MAG: hypothetical protein D6713_02850 [Deltaproteobacteria bacterium]|nr:MAG: hypothetical protein D6713_02850 [Deltaproteobacteria bacterium]